jgi:hypothetical protein
VALGTLVGDGKSTAMPGRNQGVGTMHNDSDWENWEYAMLVC